MIVILLITGCIILLYLLYPVYLMVSPKYTPPVQDRSVKEQSVSLILLTFNGKVYIQEKIELLNRELEHFQKYEFIVVDDHSTDGTQELLESLQEKFKLKLMLKNEHLGIPNSMNMSVKAARYDSVVFCDQRQRFTGDFLREIIAPLEDDEVGGVSGFISCLDNGNHLSFLRKHENFIKKCESRTGNLIGVYGPLYAIRKSCYQEIGENIILDDLYLSLKILEKKKIVLMEKCRIVDDDFISLYNCNRSKRYLQGLLQILIRKDLVGNMPFKLRIMLLWHKYLRLLIPPTVVLFYLFLAILSPADTYAAVVFAILSICILISIIARRLTIFSNLNNLFRITVYYVVSMVILTFNRIYLKINFQTRMKRS